MPGVIEQIHVIPEKGAAPEPREAVMAVAGAGLEGDHHAAPRKERRKVMRQLTLVEAEVLEELAAGYGIELSPGGSRRNLTTRGVRLNGLVGRWFHVGAVLCRGVELCEPCDRLERLTKQRLMQPMLHRGGLRAEILFSGAIRVGDAVFEAADGEAGRRA